MRIAAPLLLAAVLFLPTSARAAETASSSITLTWTAPGDDGLTGTATRYDLRYSIIPITPQNFVGAILVSGVPLPSPAGSHQTFTVVSLAPNQRYYFAIRSVDDHGNWSAISNVVQKVTSGSSVDAEGPGLVLSLSSPWPNPARQLARVNLTLPTDTEVNVEVFDIGGRRVRTLARGVRSAGESDVAWDLRDELGHAVSAGMYLMHARLGDRTFVKRLVVSR